MNNRLVRLDQKMEKLDTIIRKMTNKSNIELGKRINATPFTDAEIKIKDALNNLNGNHVGESILNVIQLCKGVSDKEIKRVFDSCTGDDEIFTPYPLSVVNYHDNPVFIFMWDPIRGVYLRENFECVVLDLDFESKNFKPVTDDQVQWIIDNLDYFLSYLDSYDIDHFDIDDY